jgi:hypothetical protein
MILAHLGHWYVSLMYFGPVAVLVGYLAIQNWRDRRNKSSDEGTE